MSNLTDHARRELVLIGEEPATIEWYCSVIDKFSEFGHSGGSASVAIPTLNKLLQYQNLSALTDDPKDWLDVGPYSADGSPLWQSRRRAEAFSEDGGQTYYLVEEKGEGIVYKTEDHRAVARR